VKVLLSPAKTLDYEKTLPTQRATTPIFEDEAEQIARKVERLTKKELKDLMSISDKLTELNYQRFKDFSKNPDTKVSRPAIFAFAGDVYDGFDAYSLSTDKLDSAQSRVRILSGLYGMLKPLDKIQRYRLEMGTKLGVGRAGDLYEHWQKKLTEALDEEMDSEELLVNCASQEYAKAINLDRFKDRLITPIFKDYKNGQLKIISFFAKKARGAMARHLVEQSADNIGAILKFNWEGYAYDEGASDSSSEPVFTR
jgi:cytoplasmic iron level regulating protein YaaA (DUF328/UPF0246 family)